MERLRHPSAKVRAQAANVLGGFELDADRVIPALSQTVKDKDRDVRLMSLHSLIRFKTKSVTAIPHIHDCVKDEDSQIASWALGVVNVCGPISDQATYDLVVDQITNASAGYVQHLAVRVLARSKIHKDQIPDVLLKALGSGRLRSDSMQENPRSACLQTLGAIAGRDPKIIRVLTEELADPRNSDGPRLAAAEALAEVGTAARSAFPLFDQVREETHDKEFHERLSRSFTKLRKAVDEADRKP